MLSYQKLFLFDFKKFNFVNTIEYVCIYTPKTVHELFLIKSILYLYV